MDQGQINQNIKSAPYRVAFSNPEHALDLYYLCFIPKEKF